jgi:predicted RNA binding protein YcfA (HicA-like mRNA interferase family)
VTRNLRRSIIGFKNAMTFSELVRLLTQNGFKLVKEKGSIRYYGKTGWDRLIRIDYHGSKEIPTGTCNAILKAAGLKK